MSNANEVDVDVATPTPKKKSCLTREGWIDMLWCYKILIGTGLLFVSCNDYLIHFIKKEPFTFEVRQLTIDLFYLFSGMVLIIGTTCAPKLFNLFAFLKSSAGMGFFLLFAGFLLVKVWDFT